MHGRCHLLGKAKDNAKVDNNHQLCVLPSKQIIKEDSKTSVLLLEICICSRAS